MSVQATASIIEHFSSIQDPRINRQKLHEIENIFFITICAVICGADNWVAIEEFGKAKEDWFTKLLDLKHGIPSHDTLGKVFAAIDSEQFGQCFTNWVSDLSSLTKGEVIAIDGKRVRRSHDRNSNKAAIHMVSAWACENHLVLGQTKVTEKSNEITAIPELLERLDIAGSIITIDAMGCQTKIAKQIVDNGADYVLSLKGNQGNLHDDIKTWFEGQSNQFLDEPTELDYGHGRIEQRTLHASSDIDWLNARHDWPYLKSIIAVRASREIDGTVSEETRYFISSLSCDDKPKLAKAIRAHWQVENNLHWVLDMAFDEDRCRIRQGHSAANMSILRHIALNLVKAEKSSKVGIKTKRLKAGWDNQYMLKILGQPN